jgi:hypothetical protein
MDPMKQIRSLAALTALALLAACADQGPVATVPAQPQPQPQDASLSLQCVAQVREGTVSCTREASAGARGDVIGGQNTYVKLTSTNVAYDTSTATFSADVTIQNLLQQAMGTIDGVTADSLGVRVFFHSGPVVTAGSGAVSVKNADGTATFTAASQPFFRYAGIIQPGATSPARSWQFNVPVTATAFAFQVYLDVRVRPRLVITEIMAHPTTTSEAAGEWFEIHNAGVGRVNLDGFTIASGGDAGYTISGPLVIPTGGYLVVGGSADTTANGGVVVGKTYSGIDLGNDDTDWLALRAPTGVAIDSVSWGAAAGDTPASPVAGVARTLVSDDSSNTHLSGAHSAFIDAREVYGLAGQRGGPGRGALLPIHGVSVGAYYFQSCASDDAGQAWCWGFNAYNHTNKALPVSQPGGLKFSSISMHQEICALSYAGQIWCWPYTPKQAFYQPALLQNQSALHTWLSPGIGPICALDAAGVAYCWGGNDYGSTVDYNSPKTDVAFNGSLVCVVSGGRVYCRGTGARGDSSATTAFGTWAEAKLPAGMQFTNVEMSATAVCALSTTGQLYCWGLNLYGEFGNGTAPSETLVNYPVPVTQPAGVAFTTFAMGSASGADPSVCALATTGQAYCWGGNNRGQLGDGTTTQRLVPTPVFQRGLVFSAIAAGGDHGCALEQGSGQPFCWGDNPAGQLGDGTTTRHLIPVAAGR